MASSIEEILKQTDALSADEKLALANKLIEQAQEQSATKPRHKWTDAIGVAPYPLTGEDAQAWISRTREEGDTERERQWRRNE
jgi:hypothetical protein